MHVQADPAPVLEGAQLAEALDTLHQDLQEQQQGQQPGQGQMVGSQGPGEASVRRHCGIPLPLPGTGQSQGQYVPVVR